MKVTGSIGGEAVGVQAAPADLVAQAVQAEADGFGSAWAVHFSRVVDALTVLGAAGPQTTTLELGVGVVPTYPRHPLALAQQAATVQALCSGRLTLGVGVSHRPVIEGLHGLAYADPVGHLREYLSVLVPLLRSGEVSFSGRHYRVDGGFTVPGTSPVPVVVGALGPRMVEVAGELADGVVTAFAGPRSLEAVVVPRLTASSAGRPPPRVIAAVAVAVCSDADASAARAAASSIFARYGQLENYQRLVAREGVAGVADLAVIGNEESVARQLDRFADVGVTELWALPLPLADPTGVARTRQLLVARARATPPGPP